MLINDKNSLFLNYIGKRRKLKFNDVGIRQAVSTVPTYLTRPVSKPYRPLCFQEFTTSASPRPKIAESTSVWKIYVHVPASWSILNDQHVAARAFWSVTQKVKTRMVI